jgi:hypothetical protein
MQERLWNRLAACVSCVAKQQIHMQQLFGTVLSMGSVSYEILKNVLKGDNYTPCGGGLEYFHRSPCKS